MHIHQLIMKRIFRSGWGKETTPDIPPPAASSDMPKAAAFIPTQEIIPGFNDDMPGANTVANGSVKKAADEVSASTAKNTGLGKTSFDRPEWYPDRSYLGLSGHKPAPPPDEDGVKNTPATHSGYGRLKLVDDSIIKDAGIINATDGE